jgi:uncharacterized protein DUF6088
MKQAIEHRILSRIYGNGRGWAFSQADFADLGTRSAIDQTLNRREKEGLIRRVIRGIYDYPRHSDFLKGKVSPDIDQVAHALARKFAWRIQPQNLLGLSTQVPARALYLSDGPDRAYTIGKMLLAFEHAALKESGFKLRESSLIVQVGHASIKLTLDLYSHVLPHMQDEAVDRGEKLLHSFAEKGDRHTVGTQSPSSVSRRPV